MVTNKKRHASAVDIGAYPIPLVGRVTTAGNNQLSAVSVPIQEVLLQASPNNANIARIGTAGAILIELEAGDAITLPWDDLNKVWTALVAGDYINWTAVCA